MRCFINSNVGKITKSAWVYFCVGFRVALDGALNSKQEIGHI